jgi:hypothetical protein
MGREHARQIDSPFFGGHLGTKRIPERDPSTPEEFVEAVNALLNNASPTRAQRVAAQGHARFPEHAELERLCRLLTLPPPRMVPGKNVDRQKAFRWLDENEIDYRGQWVALTEEGFLTSAPTLDELMRKVEAFDLEDPPLVHHIH